MGPSMTGIKATLPISTSTISKGGRLTGTGSAASLKEKEKVCKGFESYLVLNMLQEMEKSTHLTKKGYAEQTYMSFVYEKVADFIADKGIGIKEMLMRYIDKGNTKVNGESGDNQSK
jgi:Rod binding domain-containing protein